VTERRSVFDQLKARGEEVFNQMAGELMGNPRFVSALQTAMKGKERLDQAAAQALKSMNVPTRTEFKRALSRVEALEQEIAELKRTQAARPRAATASRPAAARKKKGTGPTRAE
jgi:polyhydroxyalkanoate synthesis regulator phasin